MASAAVFRPGAARALPFLFFASGFAALTMEMIWAKEISQLVGSGVRASAAVASLLLAGLAAGALAGATFADRLKRPLRAYAWAEAGIGIWALATIPLAPRLGDFIARTAPAPGPAADFGASALVAICCMVLPGALLMGVTTPLVVRSDISSLHAGSEATGRSLGRLYASNTFGGALGAWAAAFLILPAMGLRAALLLSAGISLLVACGAAWLPPSSPRTIPDGSETSKEGPRPEGAYDRRLLLAILFLAGAISMGCQVAWTRVLVLLFGSSVQALGLTLAFGLLGLASGPAVAAWALRRGVSPGGIARCTLALASGLTLLTIPAWGRLPVAVVLGQAWLGSSFTSAVALQCFFSALLVAPCAAVLGALLPALTAARSRRDPAGRSAGECYGADSAGSVLGGLAAGFILLPRLGAFDLLRALAAAAAVLLSLLALSARRTSPEDRARWPFALSVALLAGAWIIPRWDPALMTSGPLLYGAAYLRVGGATSAGIAAAMRGRGDLLFHEEGPDVTVTVRRSTGGTRSLQINGKTDASDGADLPAQILVGALPVLLHPSPGRVLVIGLATGSSDYAVAAAGVARLDGVELSPSVARAAAHFASINGGVLSDPRFHLAIGDGRAFLRSSAARFDVIVSQPTNPWVAGVTNLFTREFFRLARTRLSPGGLVAIWVQGYAMSPGDFRSVVATFLEVFPEAQLWEESPGGGDYFLMGSTGPPASLAAMQDLLESRAEFRGLLRQAGCADLAAIVARFVAGGEALRRFAASAAPITDDNLQLEYSAPRQVWRTGSSELLARLEGIRQDAAAAYPDLDLPGHAALREALRELQGNRRDRMRLALSLQREDFAALASPSLAAATLLLRQGTPEPAIPLLKRARSEAPQSPVIPLMLGWVLLQVGKAAEAEPWFSQAAAQNPASASAFEGMGQSAFRLGQAARAEGYFREAVRLAPDDPDPAASLGAMLLSLGRDTEALQALNRAVGLDPGHVASRVNRGVALARLGRLDEAIEDYRQALTADPGNEDARYNLERARQRLQETHRTP
jgi:spermidine synthase